MRYAIHVTVGGGVSDQLALSIVGAVVNSSGAVSGTFGWVQYQMVLSLLASAGRLAATKVVLAGTRS